MPCWWAWPHRQQGGVVIPRRAAVLVTWLVGYSTTERLGGRVVVVVMWVGVQEVRRGLVVEVVWGVVWNGGWGKGRSGVKVTAMIVVEGIGVVGVMAVDSEWGGGVRVCVGGGRYQHQLK